MCVYSVIVDHYYDKWVPLAPPWTPVGPPLPWPPVPQITQQELDEFRELLRKAKEYDAKHNQPDCELESKKEKVRELAEKLGVTVEFP